MFPVGDVRVLVIFCLVGLALGLLCQRKADSLLWAFLGSTAFIAITVALASVEQLSALAAFGMSTWIGFEVHLPRRRDPRLPEVTPLPEVTDLTKAVGPVTSARDLTGGPTPLSDPDQLPGSKLVH